MYQLLWVFLCLKTLLVFVLELLVHEPKLLLKDVLLSDVTEVNLVIIIKAVANHLIVVLIFFLLVFFFIIIFLFLTILIFLIFNLLSIYILIVCTTILFVLF